MNDDEINNLTERIKKIGNINSIKLFSSKINFDESMVIDWIGKNFTAELLFSTSKNGFQPSEFHKLCDNKGPTIIFIETKKGYIFGGYTELDWDTSGSYKTDDSTFLFSINNKQNIQERIKCAQFTVEKIWFHLLEVIVVLIYIVCIAVKRVVYAAKILLQPKMSWTMEKVVLK